MRINPNTMTSVKQMRFVSEAKQHIKQLDTLARGTRNLDGTTEDMLTQPGYVGLIETSIAGHELQDVILTPDRFDGNLISTSYYQDTDDGVLRTYANVRTSKVSRTESPKATTYVTKKNFLKNTQTVLDKVTGEISHGTYILGIPISKGTIAASTL